MTRLELAICEAENNGEIDIYTRDTMLGMVSEGANLNILKQKKEVKKKFKEQMKEITSLIQDGDCKKAATKIDELIKLLEAAIAELDEEDPTLVSSIISWFIGPFTGNFGRWIASTLLMIPTAGISKMAESIQVMVEEFNSSMRQYNKKGRLSVSDINLTRSTVQGLYAKYIKNLKFIKSKLSSVKPEKATKESVLAEIYESELNGYITPEERMSLIDYMDY